MKIEHLLPLPPDQSKPKRRQPYQPQPATDLPSEPVETKTVGNDKVTITPEGQARADELRDAQVRRMFRRPGRVIEANVTPAEPKK